MMRHSVFGSQFVTENLGNGLVWFLVVMAVLAVFLLAVKGGTRR